MDLYFLDGKLKRLQSNQIEKFYVINATETLIMITMTNNKQKQNKQLQTNQKSTRRIFRLHKEG